MNELERLREEIDKCDDVISSAYTARLALTRQVAQYKKHNNIEILNSNRESSILKRLTDNNDKYKEEVRNLYKFIMECSRNIQQNDIK